jgi:hypothetical protein
MRPPLWHPPVELSPAEHAIIKRIRRAKLFVCNRSRGRCAKYLRGRDEDAYNAGS